MKKNDVLKDKTILYRLSRPIINAFVKIFFHPKYDGLEHIPSQGRIILAGTHTSIMDCLLLMSSTKRAVHFLAKDELWRGLKGLYFANMGLIPVNRRMKDHNALAMASSCLEKEYLIGIFPEGTIEKEREVLLPFKIGAVKMAQDTDTYIVPFAIRGKYRVFGKGVRIKFGNPLKITGDLEKANQKLACTIDNIRKEI